MTTRQDGKTITANPNFKPTASIFDMVGRPRPGNNVDQALRSRQLLRFIDHLSHSNTSDDKIASAQAIDPGLAFAKFLASSATDDGEESEK